MVIKLKPGSLNFRPLILTVGIFMIALNSFAQKKDDTDSAKNGTFTDKRDDRSYNWVVIGKQTWMTQNLAFQPQGGGYWAYDNKNSNIPAYGYLYAFVIAKTVCPKGWHLPSDAEWRQLTKYLGGEAVAGKKMKSTDGWNKSESKGTNESGFSALAGGYRDGYGTYSGLKEIGYWWTSSATEHSYDYAWLRGLYFDKAAVGRYETFRPSGLSVRCIKNLTKQQLKEQEQEKEETIEPMDQ